MCQDAVELLEAMVFGLGPSSFKSKGSGLAGMGSRNDLALDLTASWQDADVAGVSMQTRDVAFPPSPPKRSWVATICGSRVWPHHGFPLRMHNISQQRLNDSVRKPLLSWISE